MRPAVALAVVLVVASFLAPGCGSYGEGESTPATSAARSVKCLDASCAGNDLCCTDITSRSSCSTSCTDIGLACDDAADCASGGLVCCVDILLPDGASPRVTSASCRAAEACPLGVAPPGTGPARFRGCDPLGTDCEGKGCAPLKVRYAEIAPGSLPVHVCD